ncbi:MAG: hypothetical protein WA954_12075 [Parerythrobacter sp.]
MYSHERVAQRIFHSGECGAVWNFAFADRLLNRHAAWRTTLNEAVFPFYIVHQTIIVAAIWYLRPVVQSGTVAFLSTLVLTVAGCWLTYAMGRRVSGLRLLIGLKGLRSEPRPTSG